MRIVSIQLLLLFYWFNNAATCLFSRFQYNSCYCSIGGIFAKSTDCFPVSIQLLLLFYFLVKYYFSIQQEVSIQLLLLFYKSRVARAFAVRVVSIQLLLLFYKLQLFFMKWFREFQYNSCYCSMLHRLAIATSENVFQYNSCYCSINYYRTWLYGFITFQYNSCYCSIYK